MRLSILTLFLSLLLILPANAIGEPTFEESDCEFDEPAGADIDCGYLIVPENRNDPDSDDIRIHVAILRNPNDDVEPDPIIYLEGGPGGSALKYLSFSYAERYEPLFATNRDIIVFDQRGIGLSKPALDCPDYVELGIELADYELDGEELNYEEASELGQEALIECAEELASEHDLEGYNTIQNAADVEDLRIALGYDEVNLWGISYGTRLALGVMRDFPEHIRSVVIDSVYTPDATLYPVGAEGFDRALTVLFDTCESDDACNEFYPNLRDVFFETAAALNEEPVTFDSPNPLTGDSFENVVLDGYGFVGIIFQLLYDTNSLMALPELIYEVSNGDYGSVAIMYGAVLSQSDVMSNGMHYSVQCNEELSFSGIEDIDAVWEDYPELAEYFNPLDNVDELFERCAAFGSGEAPASENEAVSSDIPTLVTTGEFDPITPPEWGARAAETLSNSVYVNFPYTGHGGTSLKGCAQNIMMDFFMNPEPEELDTTCVDEISGTFTGTGDLEVDFSPLDMSDLGIDATTIVPSDWEEQANSPGLFLRGESSFDLTLVQIVIVPNFDDAEELADALSRNLEIDINGLETYEADNSEWNVYPLVLLSTAGKIAISIVDDTGVIFLAIGEEAVYETVLLPMLDAFEVED